jgi:two-component system sensor histidine kinase RpfC
VPERSGSEAAAPLGRRSALAALALTASAVLCPVALAVLPGGDRLRAVLPGTSILLLAAVVLAPAAVAIVATMRGLPTLARAFHRRVDSEHEQIIVRVLFGALVFLYTLFLLGEHPQERNLVTALLIAGFGSALSWLFLLQIALAPRPALWRRLASMGLDIGALSAFLVLGGELTAAWYPIYLWVTFGYGFRYGLRSLLFCGALSVGAFALVIATTPFWTGHLFLAGGLMLALIVLPAYVATLIHRLTEAKAQAEEANAAKGRFLAIMSHELRTPLNSIIGMGSVIEKGRLDPDQREMLTTMQLAARTLLGLINDILDFSKIEAGRFQPENELFDLYEVAQAAIAMLRPEAAAKGLQLSLRIDPSLPAGLRGWPQQLRQILTNLVANAVKFTSRGRVSVILEAAVREGRSLRLRIVVRDQGIGIPQDSLDKIFDLFTQADGAVTRRYGGTGLGLAIVKQLTGLMGGTIAVESAVGAGSTFTVELPFEIESSAGVWPPDLQGRAFAVLSRDAEFVQPLSKRLAGWGGEAVPVDESGTALERLVEAEAAGPLVVIDGRGDTVGALSLGHRLAGHPALFQPVLLLVVEAAARDHVAELAAELFAAVLPTPLEETSLANALRVLPPLLPRAAAQPAAAAPVEPSAPPAAPRADRRLRILIAEDNAANRKIIKRILDIAGHETEMVHDGEAALTALDSSTFDAVLMDVNMPEMSGYEAAKLYRATHLDGPRLPIIALTADATPETERLCREGGMDAVLTKPVEAEQLLAALQETLRRVSGVDVGIRKEAPLSSVVTPITAHPKFLPDSAATVDEAAIEALRSLGAGTDFFNDVIHTFRHDSRQILELLKHAVAAGDVRAFKEQAHALRSSAANVGGARLCQVLLSMREVSSKDLRQHGVDFIERLQAEFSRLDAALEQKLQDVGHA